MHIFPVVTCFPLIFNLCHALAVAPSKILPKAGTSSWREHTNRGPFSKSRTSRDLRSLFSMFKPRETQENSLQQIIERRHTMRKEQCEQIQDSAFINDECYAFFNMQLFFDEAHDLCELKGAKMWTPDLRDPFLFAKLVRHMPEMFVTDDGGTWMDVRFDPSTGIYTEAGDLDVSDAYLIKVDDGDSGLNYNPALMGEACQRLEFDYGSLYTRTSGCQRATTVVCEFPLKEVEVEENVPTEDAMKPDFWGMLVKKGK